MNVLGIYASALLFGIYIIDILDWNGLDLL